MDKMEFLERLTKAVEDARVDIAREYNDYVKVAYAIAYEYGEAGRNYFKRICMLSDLYEEKNAKDLYDFALTHADGSVTMGTVVEFAKRKKVKIPKELKSSSASKSAAKGKAKAAADGTDGKAEDAQQGNGRGRVMPTKIADFIWGLAEFRNNRILGQTEIRWKEDKEDLWTPITDRDISTLWTRMSDSGIPGGELHINSVIQSALTPWYNPFEEYFNSLPEWDGQTDYIKLLAERVRLVNDTPEQREYFLKCLLKWIVAMVAGMIDPTVINHEILTFIGKQGNYKSTFFSHLLPPCLSQYYVVRLKLDRASKDDLFAIAQNALICLEEIDCLRQAELNEIKAIVTMTKVKERRAYGRHTDHLFRTASFCSTGNNLQFLNDRTGNRRWLTFEVDSIDSPLEHPFNYEGIYSQAWHLYKTGFQHWFDSKEVEEINAQNAQFEAPGLEEELISLYYAVPEKDSPTAKLVSTAEILERINVMLKQPLSAIRVGIAMKKLRYLSKRTKTGMKYLVYERTQSEIDMIKMEEIRNLANSQEKLADDTADGSDKQLGLPF